MKNSKIVKFGGAGLAAAVGLSLMVSSPAMAAPRHDFKLTTPTSMEQSAQTPSKVVVESVAKKDRISVSWGDGTVEKRTTDCSLKKAKESPKKCSLTFTNEYSSPGDYLVHVTNRGGTIGKAEVRIYAPAKPAIAPDDSITHGWSSLRGRATFAPCSTVPWSFDGSGGRAEHAGAIEDARWALNELSRETGLTFQQVDDPSDAKLRISMEDLGPGGPAGLGGGGYERGTVRINTNPDIGWSKDEWAGGEVMKVKRWREGNTTWTLRQPGRGWLFIHEIMHALGFGHVDAGEGREIMNPKIEVGGFGPGDLEGLHTMYLNQPCTTAAA